MPGRQVQRNLRRILFLMCGHITKGKLRLMNTHNCRLGSLSQRAMRLLLIASYCLIFAALAHAQDQTFIVPGTSGSTWVDTHLDIAPGTLLRLAAVGEVEVADGGFYGPRGTLKFADAPGFPAQTRYRYGLVARLTTRLENPGRSRDELYEQWSYGELPGNRYCATRGGHLWLTVNDNSPKDNRGAFTVILTRGTCPSAAEETRTRVNLYTADESSYRPRTQFRIGDNIVLKIENNTALPIYLTQARDSTVLIREEGLQVERAVGSGYIPVLPSGAMPEQVIVNNGPNTATSTFAGGSTQVIELRSTMNITRRWVVKAPNVPGSYRLKLVYYNSRNTQTTPVTIYSPNFEVQ